MTLNLISFDIKDPNVPLYYIVGQKKMRKANVSIIFICKSRSD